MILELDSLELRKLDIPFIRCNIAVLLAPFLLTTRIKPQKREMTNRTLIALLDLTHEL